MTIGHLLLTAALTLALPGSSTAPMEPLGIVTEANGARLSNSSVSTGTTVFDGDHLSTEAAGTLRVRSGSAVIYLAGASQVTLHSVPAGAKGTAADLTAGRLVFSSVLATAVEIRAHEASIRPATDAPTVGQIAVVGPKKLYISARRGSLIFSYHEESEIISEGQSYRVVLDPPDDDPAAKPDVDHPDKKPARRRRGFLFFLIGAALVPTIHSLLGASESPYRP